MGIEIVNVRIPSEIVKWLDSLVEKGIYNSRAEAIREFCRGYLQKRGK
ncbi:MAG TPA: ribbon-helix-helix domain-containing protein [Candidatus Nanoarchaeia archaeon]|nr:ribbon-helix-helix domain-containing protein [Candidatus Nanoarchaeia archaeon]